MSICDTITDVILDTRDRMLDAKTRVGRQMARAKIDAHNRKIAPTCRCGARAVAGSGGWWVCPRSDDEQEYAIKHDMVSQSYDEPYLWNVVKEPGGWRAHCDRYDHSPDLFATEDAAWAELEAIYWGHKDWPEDEEEDG